jgi:hypothetical protein
MVTGIEPDTVKTKIRSVAGLKAKYIAIKFNNLFHHGIRAGQAVVMNGDIFCHGICPLLKAE